MTASKLQLKTSKNICNEFIRCFHQYVSRNFFDKFSVRAVEKDIIIFFSWVRNSRLVKVSDDFVKVEMIQEER